MSHPHTEREVEHKFRVHGLFNVPDLHGVEGVDAVDDLGTVELVSSYFDTPDLRLAREGITLRRRTGDDQGWHLKIPADRTSSEVRDEIRLPLEASAAAPPVALLDIIRVIVRTAPVQLVSVLRTDRSKLEIRNGKGRPVAELVDDTVHVISPDGTVTARFRELELEQRQAGKVLDHVAEALASAGAVSGEFVAKVVRALGPAAASAAEIPPAEPPQPDSPAGSAATAYVVKQARALRDADIAFRRHPEQSEDAVHKMRVAARRLRSAIRTFRPLLDPGWAGHMRGELAWFARGLGELREYEVLRARLRAHVTELPAEVPAERARQYLDAELETSVQRARAAASELLGAGRYVALHEEFARTGGRPPLTGQDPGLARDVLPQLVRGAWERLWSAASDLNGESDPQQWHDVRLLAKRTRYAAECVALALGDDARAFARQMERLTELLGEHQDAAQAGELLERLAQQSHDTETAFGLGALATIERGYAREARQRFASIWLQASHPRWRGWFTAL
nr:CYTH and CHAD domain-containing protein [Phytoactinopolyspora mesophila]